MRCTPKVCVRGRPLKSMRGFSLVRALSGTVAMAPYLIPDPNTVQHDILVLRARRFRHQTSGESRTRVMYISVSRKKKKGEGGGTIETA